MAERQEVPGGPLDLRLVLPAVLAWAALVVLLPLGARALITGAVVAAAVGAGSWLGPGSWAGVGSPSRRGSKRASPSWRDVHRHAAPVIGLAAALIAVLLSAAAAQVAAREAGPVRELARERAVVEVSGRVGSDPRLLRAGPERRTDAILLRLQVEEVNGRGARSTTATPVLVWAPPSWAGLRWNERIHASGRLLGTEDGGDVVARFVPSGPPRVVAEAGAVSAGAEHVRGALREAVASLPQDAQGLVPGLVIGDTSLTPEDLTEAMRVSSLTHLSAVSGSNVAIVLAAALGLARAVRLPRRWRPAWAGLVLVGFVVLARPEPSVLRAAVMGAVGLVGVSSSRRSVGPPALGAAVLVLLLADPWLARSYGFALSTLATIGLLVFARPWGEALGRFLPSRWRGVGPILMVPLAAQVMCAPVIVLLSSSVSLIGVAANVAAAPLVAPTTIVGLVAALAATVWVPLGSWVAALAAVPALGIAQVARRSADVPFAALPWPGGVPGAVLLAGLTALALLTGPWLVAHALRRPLAAASALAIAAACVAPVSVGGWPDPRWRYVLCDVGQGDGMVLRTGPSAAVVVDVGPAPAPIARCLDRLGVTAVDALILTHLHDDHSGGLDGVLRRWPVREAFTGGVDDPPHDARRVASALAARGVPLHRVHRGDVLRWGAVTARVRWPEGRTAAGSVPNNNSVVLDVDVDGLRLFLMADIEREAGAGIRAELAREGDSRPVDALKVAHHGSANHDRDLLMRLRPRTALISVGADNTFGHPAPSLMASLEGTGAAVLRTDRDGDLLVAVVDGRIATATSRRRARQRPWPIGWRAGWRCDGGGGLGCRMVARRVSGGVGVSDGGPDSRVGSW